MHCCPRMGDVTRAPRTPRLSSKAQRDSGAFLLAAAEADEHTVDVRVVVIASDFHLCGASIFSESVQALGRPEVRRAIDDVSEGNCSNDIVYRSPHDQSLRRLLR